MDVQREQVAGTTERQGLNVNTPTKRRKVTGYRLGLYDPDPSSTAVEFVGRFFKATPMAKAALARIIARYNRKVANDPDGRLCLAAFPVER